MFAGSTRSAAAMSWRRSAALVRASAYSTTPRASGASTAERASPARPGATWGGPVGLGLPDPRDHLGVALLTLASRRPTLRTVRPNLTLGVTQWAYMPIKWAPGE